jgi:FkbM family methyltransferase
MNELVRRELTFISPEGLALLSMPNNISSMQAYVAGDFENKLHRFIAGRLKRKSTFCDVGANIGRYTVQAAQLVGPEGKVVAFEAHPYIFGFLSRNVKAHGLTNVIAINAAVGAEAATVSLNFQAGDAGSTHVSSAKFRDRLTVEQVTLDEILGSLGIEHIDYLKVDVEGFELFVLKGAHRLINKNPNIIVQTEIDLRHLERFGVSVADIVGFFSVTDLSPYIVDSSGNAVAIESKNIQYGDFVWMNQASSGGYQTRA